MSTVYDCCTLYRRQIKQTEPELYSQSNTVRQCLFCMVREVCPQHVLQYILRERSEVQTNTHEIIQTNVTWTVELIGKTQQGERWVY